MSIISILTLAMYVIALIVFIAGSVVLWKIFGKSIKANMKSKKKSKVKEIPSEEATTIKSKGLKGLNAKSQKADTAKTSRPVVIDEDITLEGKSDKQEGLSLGDWNGVK